MKIAFNTALEGLRGVALTLILLFHAGFSSFSNGFVGVDIFLVISGYLITSQVLAELDRCRFSLILFYEKRLWRLAPAAVVVLTATAVISSVILTPEELADYGKSLAFSVLWASNFYFWNSASYFDLSSSVKPLLHLWSLSLEVQFYLTWPLLLQVLQRFRRPIISTVLAVITVACVFLTFSGAFESTTTFYLLPFRLFEFSLGSVVAVIPLPQRRMQNPLAAIGLLLVLIVSTSPIGSKLGEMPIAILSCAGTAFVILGSDGQLAKVALGNALTRSIGRISYSTYLVHWPVVVYLTFLMDDARNLSTRLTLLAVSLVVGALLYRVIEMPFRVHFLRQNHFSRLMKGSIYGFSSVVLLTAGVLMFIGNGWDWRYSKEVRQQMRINLENRLAWKNLELLDRPFEATNLPKVLIVGDSQAGDFLNTLLDSKMDANYEIRTNVVKSQCQAVVPRSEEYFEKLKVPYSSTCRENLAKFVSSSKIAEADIVVLASNWRMRGVSELNHTVRYYLGRGVKKVIVVGRKDQGMSGQSLLRKFGSFEHINELSAKFPSREAEEINAALSDVVKGASIVDLMAVICPSKEMCWALSPSNEVIFADELHFTQAGTRFMADLFRTKGVFDFDSNHLSGW